MRHHFHINFKITLLFYTIQNKSEKNIHAMIICIHTCKSKLNLFFLESHRQLLERDLIYKSSSSSIQFLVVFLSRYTLNQFQLRVCIMYPPPPTNFSTDFGCFREWRLPAPPPPCMATPLMSPYLFFGFPINLN